MGKSSLLIIKIGALLLALGVGLGALGSHALTHIANAKAIGYWATATQYLFIHAIGVIFVGILSFLKLTSPYPAWLFIVGILLFSGSLYAMALGATTILGMMTPLGGIGFMVGWVWLALSVKRPRKL